ncbi:MAG: hypothetical protein M1816_001845 [Peltula sp. TS41687]|nr:MAG: hypothetical protein M1816_001845 [Peltula sp. TS41687]
MSTSLAWPKHDPIQERGRSSLDNEVATPLLSSIAGSKLTLSPAPKQYTVRLSRRALSNNEEMQRWRRDIERAQRGELTAKEMREHRETGDRILQWIQELKLQYLRQPEARAEPVSREEQGPPEAQRPERITRPRGGHLTGEEMAQRLADAERRSRREFGERNRQTEEKYARLREEVVRQIHEEARQGKITQEDAEAQVWLVDKWPDEGSHQQRRRRRPAGVEARRWNDCKAVLLTGPTKRLDSQEYQACLHYAVNPKATVEDMYEYHQKYSEKAAEIKDGQDSTKPDEQNYSILTNPVQLAHRAGDSIKETVKQTIPSLLNSVGHVLREVSGEPVRSAYTIMPGNAFPAIIAP